MTGRGSSERSREDKAGRKANKSQYGMRPPIADDTEMTDRVDDEVFGPAQDPYGDPSVGRWAPEKSRTTTGTSSKQSRGAVPARSGDPPSSSSRNRDRDTPGTASAGTSGKRSGERCVNCHQYPCVCGSDVKSESYTTKDSYGTKDPYGAMGPPPAPGKHRDRGDRDRSDRRTDREQAGGAAMPEDWSGGAAGAATYTATTGTGLPYTATGSGTDRTVLEGSYTTAANVGMAGYDVHTGGYDQTTGAYDTQYGGQQQPYGTTGYQPTTAEYAMPPGYVGAASDRSHGTRYRDTQSSGQRYNSGASGNQEWGYSSPATGGSRNPPGRQAGLPAGRVAAADGGGGGGSGGGGRRQNEYFVPKDGIDREVITADICRYLGADALVRPGEYYDKVNKRTIQGFTINAYRNLTTSMIEDLKADSQRWYNEKQGQGGRTRTNYAGSDTRQYSTSGGGYGGHGGDPMDYTPGGQGSSVYVEGSNFNTGGGSYVSAPGASGFPSMGNPHYSTGTYATGGDNSMGGGYATGTTSSYGTSGMPPPGGYSTQAPLYDDSMRFAPGGGAPGAGGYRSYDQTGVPRSAPGLDPQSGRPQGYSGDGGGYQEDDQMMDYPPEGPGNVSDSRGYGTGTGRHDRRADHRDQGHRREERPSRDSDMRDMDRRGGEGRDRAERPRDYGGRSKGGYNTGGR